MIVMLMTFNVALLVLFSALIGYFFGKGRIEFPKKLSEEDREAILRMQKEQEEAIERYNGAIEQLGSFMGGDKF